MVTDKREGRIVTLGEALAKLMAEIEKKQKEHEAAETAES